MEGNGGPQNDGAGGEDEVLGLEQGLVRLHAPCAAWGTLYREEERRLRAALAPFLVDVEHFGSTSVPNLKAKPILDILVGIRDFADGPQCMAPLEALGYEYAPEAGIPGDYTFGKGLRRTHLVHVVEYGSANWINNLCFRDALRGDPQLAHEYEALKMQLRQRYGNSRPDYTAGKTAFVEAVVAASLRRRGGQP